MNEQGLGRIESNVCRVAALLREVRTESLPTN